MGEEIVPMNSKCLLALCTILMCNDDPSDELRVEYDTMAEWANNYAKLTYGFDSWIDFYLTTGGTK